MSTDSGGGKPPFIFDQGIDLLIDRATPRRRLRPEAFRGQRLKDQNGSQDSRQGSPDEDDEKFWKPLSREQLVRGNVEIDGIVFPLHRVVLTTDAGIGKTINMKFLTYALNVEWPEQMAVFLLATQLTAGPDKLIESVLVDAWFDASGVQQHERAQKRDDYRYALEQRLRRGRLILVIDGLDHVGASGPVGHLQALLADPSWRQCRVFLSSRPHALHRHWDELLDNQQIDWNYLRLQEFTPEQQERFLGKKLYEAVPREARRILSVPRVLHYIREFLPEDQLRNLKTPSDVYHKSVCHMIHEGLRLRPQARRFGRPRWVPDPGDADTVDEDAVLQLLAGIAFQMTATQQVQRRSASASPSETPWRGPNFQGVEKRHFQSFLKRLVERIPRYRAGCWNVPMMILSRCLPRPFGHVPVGGPRQLKHDLECLDAMNSGLSYGIFDVDHLNRILWRDRTLQEFFTAYWMSNYFDGSYVEDPETGLTDAQRLHDWLPLAHEPATEDYYWVWRFATEMPDEARSDRQWLSAIRTLYNHHDRPPGPAKRATEMIYRSWETTLRRYIAADLSMEIRDYKLARQTLAEYQSEFAAICSAADESSVTAKKLAGNFVQLPKSNSDKIAITAMAKYPVTNVEYELFEPSHQARRWKPEGHPLQGDDGHGDDECPVVNVSFYDAWAYCLWLGSGYKLPTSEEWEYACRAGTLTDYSYGDEEELLVDYAWYRENSRFKNGSRGTHPVGEKLPNLWGLYDMHGNVWEWCESWYWYTHGVDRVNRGGSWDYGARYCRSGLRNWNRPDYRYHSLGFRVAQVPSSQASEAELGA